MPDTSKKPTKKQGEVLAWMVHCGMDKPLVRIGRGGRRIEQDREINGGGLIEFYSQRTEYFERQYDAARARGEKPQRPEYMGRGGYARHGWRRASGTVLARLCKDGFLNRVSIVWGSPYYVLTQAGIDAGREVLDKNPPVWLNGGANDPGQKRARG